MTSSFAWIDFNESDRRTALDIIDLFREKGTVDELGLGTVRDAIANLLFPGTSTIMTRARYYLFIPWIYRRHEDRKIPSNEIAQRARQDETKLIESLIAGGESRGVIGIESRAALKRLPSTIYWQGLQVLGIKQFDGSIDAYHRSVDRYYRRSREVQVGDDKEIIIGGAAPNWDRHIPPAPADLRESTTFRLLRREARYLRERIIHEARWSLFAYLVDREEDVSGTDFPWVLESLPAMPLELQEQLIHAREFSQVMHGAALLYNLMLAQKRGEDDRITDYRDRLDHWIDGVRDRETELRRWDRAAFWIMIERTGARVTMPTRHFIDTWFHLTLEGDVASVRTNRNARVLITSRERALKGSLARLESVRALNLWNGASGVYAMDYRWRKPVRDILEDIRLGLGEV